MSNNIPADVRTPAGGKDETAMYAVPLQSLVNSRGIKVEKDKLRRPRKSTHTVYSNELKMGLSIPVTSGYRGHERD